MKTGFICASGFNLVASATRNGKRLIAVVLGSHSSAVRAQKAAQLLERGFNDGSLSWLTPSLGTVDALSRSMPRRPTCVRKCAAVIGASRRPRRMTRRQSCDRRWRWPTAQNYQFCPRSSRPTE